MTDMKVTSRQFQREFARMKRMAVDGETVTIVSDEQEFVFHAVKPRTWQAALKGKVRITGDILNTGIEWETSK
jgi:hypothetical protein